MSRKDTEQQVKKLSVDYIFEEAVGSLLLLLMSAVEGENAKVEELPSAADYPEFAGLQEQIKKMLIRLEDLLGEETEAQKEALAEAQAMKVQLMSIYEMLYGYFSQWNICSAAVGDEMALRRYREEPVEPEKINWSIFIADCKAFLEESKDVLDEKERMGQLLKCIPMRMARDKYYHMIGQSMDAALTGESEAFIEKGLSAFRGFCFPEKMRDYGKYFPDVAIWLGQKQMFVPAQAEDDTLDDMYDEMREMFETLTKLEDYCSCVLHDIHSLILLLSLSYSFEDLTEREAAYGDLYHAVCEILEGDMEEAEKLAMLDTIQEQLEKIVEPVIDRANDIGRQEMKLMEELGSFAGLEEDTKKVLMTEEFIRQCFFGEPNDELFRMDSMNDLPAADEVTRQESISDFLEQTRAHFDTLPVTIRKIAMQTLLGALPPVYTAAETVEKIEEAMEQCRTLEEKILIVDKVGAVFGEYGFRKEAMQEADPMQEAHMLSNSRPKQFHPQIIKR